MAFVVAGFLAPNISGRVLRRKLLPWPYQPPVTRRDTRLMMPFAEVTAANMPSAEVAAANIPSAEVMTPAEIGEAE